MNIEDCEIGQNIRINAPDPSSHGELCPRNVCYNTSVWSRAAQGSTATILEIDSGDCSLKIDSKSIVWLPVEWAEPAGKKPTSPPTACQCPIWGPCTCGVFTAEMLAKGRVFDKVYGMWC